MRGNIPERGNSAANVTLRQVDAKTTLYTPPMEKVRIAPTAPKETLKYKIMATKQRDLDQKLLMALGISKGGAKIVMEEITRLRDENARLGQYKWSHDQMMIRVEEGTPIIFEGRIRYERVPNADLRQDAGSAASNVK